jgi:pyridoxine 4-dehydrogenase
MASMEPREVTGATGMDTSSPETPLAAAAGHWDLGGELSVTRMGFGAMRLPARTWSGPPVDPATAIATVRRAVELGVTHIDTSGFYFFGDTYANDLLVQALYPYPADLVIATKVGPRRGATSMLPDAGPDDLPHDVEADLRRLRQDHLDLVTLRVGGIQGPTQESIADRFAALAALRDRGLIRHLGLSNVTAEQLSEAEQIAPVAAVQNHYNFGNRADEEMVDLCTARGIAYVPYFPLGGGRQPIEDGEGRIGKVAAGHGASSAQVVLAWLLARSPAILLIPGTSSPAHVEENVTAATLTLSPDDIATLSS